ncbi:hypothetical protein RJ639_029472, partial [Escallonia herrerae]
MAMTLSSGSINLLTRRVFYSKPNIQAKPVSSLRLEGRTVASSMSYDKELAAAKKAASLAARLCQALPLTLCFLCCVNVQKGLLQSDVHSKSDKSPVTVADYGSQVLVSFVLKRELPFESFSLDSGDLRKQEGQETLQRITKIVNDTLDSDLACNEFPLSEEDVLDAIDSGKSEGGSRGRHWVLDPIDGTKGTFAGARADKQ